MRIAIIGAGFCGLAVTWHLLQHQPAFPDLKIHLIDAKEIGQGVSGMAAGLLHPYSGAHSKLNRMGHEGLQETLKLLHLASQTLGHSVTAPDKGILRLALNEEQILDFTHCAQRYPQDTEWLDAPSNQKIAPGCAHAPGLWIKEGLTVYSALYLQGLWQACAQHGVQFEQRQIASLKETESFDITIVTAGADSKHLPELNALPIHAVKGQLLEMTWPQEVPALKYPLNSHVYLTMTETGTSCFVGATYERNSLDERPHLEVAMQKILPKAYQLFPPLQQAQVLNCYAGFRATTPQHLPFIKRLSAKQWVLTGMGSKGLLYHALFAKKLVQQIR